MFSALPRLRRPRFDQRMRNEVRAIFVIGTVNRLHGSARQPDLLNRGERLFRQKLTGPWVARVRLGDDRVSGRDGRGKISPGDPVECQREIVGTEDGHRSSERAEHRTDVGLGVDGGLGPASLARRRGGLSELIAGARQLDVGQPWRERKRRFEGTFSLVYDEENTYTNKSQFLVHVSLTGGKNSNLIGNGFDNTLTGNTGDNRFTPGPGNDTLDGGEGTDTAVFSGPSADYTVTNQGDVVTVKDESAERDGENALRNIERLQFTDKVLTTEEAAAGRT